MPYMSSLPGEGFFLLTSAKSVEMAATENKFKKIVILGSETKNPYLGIFGHLGSKHICCLISTDNVTVVVEGSLEWYLIVMGIHLNQK